MTAVTSMVKAFLVLMAFGLIAWLYTAFGRIYVGLNGWNETILIGVALWTVRDHVSSAVGALTGPLDRGAAKIKAALAK